MYPFKSRSVNGIKNNIYH